MGYIGFFMSERAAAAYADGEAPLSKWDRARLERCIRSYPDSEWTREELSCATVADLRRFFLIRSGWHHTGKLYSRTDFYAIDDDAVLAHDAGALREAAERSRAERAERARARAREKVFKGRIVYDQWVGSRKHGRFERRDELCLLIGDWAYTESGRKRLDGGHVVACTAYDRAPRGCAEAYRALMKTLPAPYRRA